MVRILFIFLIMSSFCFGQDVIQNMTMGTTSSSGYFAQGTYTGTGTDGDTVVVPFQPDVVIVKKSTIAQGVWRTSAMGADTTAYIANTVANFNNGIQSFIANGFTKGSDSLVNLSGGTYYWQAWRNEAGVSYTGKYYGNGADDRWIDTGTGLDTISLILIKRAGASAMVGRSIISGAGDSSYQFSNADPLLANIIQTMAGDSFQVGTHATVNTASNWYYYWIYKRVVGQSGYAQYTGNQTARSFVTEKAPNSVWILPHTAINEAHKTTTMPASGYLAFANTAIVTAAPALSTLNVDGFSVTTATTFNANTSLYDYFWWATR